MSEVITKIKEEIEKAADLFKCEYCGRFISHKNIDAHFDGDKTIIDSRMHYTGYPEPEPWGNLYWHVECENKRKPKDQKDEG